MNDYIQINKFSDLHNGKTIFFCKTDYILQDFKTISNIDNKVVLITGNSDYSITDDIVKLCPVNVIRWYAQNALSYDDRLSPIPMGIENKNASLRDGHGIGYYDRVTEKENIISNLKDINPIKFIYANFNVNTNYNYRTHILNICNTIEYIHTEQPVLSLSQFFNRILEYKMILCPIGNGIDTHRLWEVLYCGRIPITIKAGDFKIYELYEKFPIIVLDNLNLLRDKTFLEDQYKIAKNKLLDQTMLYSQYWKNQFIKHAG